MNDLLPVIFEIEGWIICHHPDVVSETVDNIKVYFDFGEKPLNYHNHHLKLSEKYATLKESLNSNSI